MTVEAYQAKINEAVGAGELKCFCWDCLRRMGITPRRANADRHRDLGGKIHRADNGQVDRVSVKEQSAASEAEIVMQRGRGQDV